jgi:hypothetical protein
VVSDKKFPCEAVITLVTSEENPDEATKAYVTYTKVYRVEFVSEQDFKKWLEMAETDLSKYTTPLGVETGTDERHQDALNVEQLKAQA